MEQLLCHVDKNMIKYEDFMEMDTKSILEGFPVEGIFAFDTESCYIDETKDEVKVYAWSIGNSESDVQVYGTELDDIYSVFDKIARARWTEYKDASGAGHLKVFVHNLKWDAEFMLYSLNRMGFNYYLNEVRYGGLDVTKRQPCGTFNVVRNNDTVYSAKVVLHDTIKLQSKRKNKNGEYNSKEVKIEINFIDSQKIMNKKLDVIAREVIKIKEMHYKMSEQYDYELIREAGHVLNDLERCYLYNDVYILKEFAKQFYLPLGTEQTTASSISFEAFLKETFKQDTMAKNYKIFKSIYPDLTNQMVISNMIKKSYKGGMTQVNEMFEGRKMHVNGVSIDINSSYPAVIRNCMLPYCHPIYYSRDISREKMNEMGYDMKLMTIAFDAFMNNEYDNLIGEIQLMTANNVLEFTEAFGKPMSASKYVHTNIIGGFEKDNGDTIVDFEKLVGTYDTNGKRRYVMRIWDFELENMLENMSFYLQEKKQNKRTGKWKSEKIIKKGYEVLECLLFKGTVGMFAEAVDVHLQGKIESKKVGNVAMTEFHKIVLNSFYGKMGSSPDRIDKSYTMNDKGMIVRGETEQSYKSAKRYYQAFASAVTAWARVNLRTTLYKIGYNNVMYWDTDSLYTTVSEEYIREHCGDILHPTELGKWDVEKHYTELKAIGAKKYIVKTTDGEIVCKCAGLPEDVRNEITFNEFEIGAVFEGKKAPVKKKGGYALEYTTFTIKNELL